MIYGLNFESGYDRIVSPHFFALTKVSILLNLFFSLYGSVALNLRHLFNSYDGLGSFGSNYKSLLFGSNYDFSHNYLICDLLFFRHLFLIHQLFTLHLHLGHLLILSVSTSFRLSS